MWMVVCIVVLSVSVLTTAGARCGCIVAVVQQHVSGNCFGRLSLMQRLYVKQRSGQTGQRLWSCLYFLRVRATRACVQCVWPVLHCLLYIQALKLSDRA